MVDEQRKELQAAMHARLLTNRATSNDVLKIQAELAVVKKETAAAKESFVAKCKKYNDEVRYIPSQKLPYLARHAVLLGQFCVI